MAMIWLSIGLNLLFPFVALRVQSYSFVLNSSAIIRPYFDAFLAADKLVPGFDDALFVRNEKAYDFLKDQIPLVEIPEKRIEETYYFRWWMFRKHIKEASPHGVKYSYLITEFIHNVPWAGLHSSISCAAGHHFREGRWLHNTTFLESYAHFWYSSDGGDSRMYSSWLADSLLAFAKVTGTWELLIELLPKLVRNFDLLLATNYNKNTGLFFNTDNRDGMELSIGGNGGRRAYRATLNSYAYGDAVAIAKIAFKAEQPEIVKRFQRVAAHLRYMTEKKLWDASANFFKVLAYSTDDASIQQPLPSVQAFSNVRELHGFTPWYFHLPRGRDKLVAFGTLTSNASLWGGDGGFCAKYGLTTAEQRHPLFSLKYSWLSLGVRGAHECAWNGPVWPYATSVTLTALANVLNTPIGSQAKYVSRHDYYSILKTYAYSHKRGTSMWIDEDQHPYTGDWMARTILKNASWPEKKGGRERGKDYNHSTFIDLLITGLLGFRPRADGKIIDINPLLPLGEFSYFCIDNLRYHHHTLTIVWDEHGTKYAFGAGLFVFVDKTLVASQRKLARLRIELEEE